MTEMTLSGGCLCGSVQYEVTGEPLRFVHCHCWRCRKASGTGHATNLILKSEHLEWKSGEDQLVRFKVPDAKRFATTFCKTCGGPLPRVGTDMVVIPAGSLDTVPEIKPEGRIFWESRVTWCCSTDDLPTFAEYPTS